MTNKELFDEVARLVGIPKFCTRFRLWMNINAAPIVRCEYQIRNGTTNRMTPSEGAVLTNGIIDTLVNDGSCSLAARERCSDKKCPICTLVDKFESPRVAL